MRLTPVFGVSAFFAMVADAYQVKPFKVDLSPSVPHMRDLIQRTHLPVSSVLSAAPQAGISLSWLRDRQTQWLDDFDWKHEEDALNKSVLLSIFLAAKITFRATGLIIPLWRSTT